jgi:CBS domain-containing protein/RNA polymerase-binding transcription factor DksA
VDVSVKHWMSGDPVSLEPSASALEALELMVDHGIRHLPVVDARRRVVGVVTIDDLRSALPFAVSHRAPPSPAERELASESPVSEVMTYAPVTLGEESSLEEAASAMAERRIGCLPIVDGDGCLAGLLSETDVLQALVTSLWSDRVRVERRGSALEDVVAALECERAAIEQQHQSSAAGELDEPARRRCEAIDVALARHGEGRLGVCEHCGGSISVARLRARPAATSCLSCARSA